MESQSSMYITVLWWIHIWPETIAISSSRGSSWPRDWTRISCCFCTGRQNFYHWATREALFLLDTRGDQEDKMPSKKEMVWGRHVSHLPKPHQEIFSGHWGQDQFCAGYWHSVRTTNHIHPSRQKKENLFLPCGRKAVYLKLKVADREGSGTWKRSLALTVRTQEPRKPQDSWACGMLWAFLLLLTNSHCMPLLTPRVILKGTASHAVSLLHTHTPERPSLGSGSPVYGHTTLNVPDLVWSRKLSRVGTG